MQKVNGKSFNQEKPDLVMFTDASLSGWGAVCDGVRTRGPWTFIERSRHINELELLGALFALQTFTSTSRNISVEMFLDNSTAVAYINKSGGSRSKALSDIASKIVSWCEEREIRLTSSHLPGILNSVADKESRTVLDTSDWMLHQETFRQLSLIWKMKTDLFASAWNAQLPQFISWAPQPNAMAVNAFAQDWRNLHGYAFPPFALIPRILFKLKRDQIDLVLVCPWWPSQPWFPQVIRMCIDIPRVFRPDPFLIHSPMLEPHPLLRSNRFLLIALRLSGVISKARDFRQTLSTFCYKVPVSLPDLVTNPRGKNGVIGVVDEVQIPCLLL